MLEYFEYPELPGRQHFRCNTLHATLSVPSCADMWRKSRQDDPPERLLSCKTCPIGAVHAGETAASLSPLHGSMVCTRCHRGATRLIGKLLCPSCWNRQREYLVGRNAKGEFPTKYKPLRRRRIHYWARGQNNTLIMDLTHDQSELFVSVLRECDQVAKFAFRADAQDLRQLRLF